LVRRAKRAPALSQKQTRVPCAAGRSLRERAAAGGKLSAEASHRIASAGFLTRGSPTGCAFSCVCAQWTYATALPTHSDRIVQDSHLIPFYPNSVAQRH